MNNDGVSFVVLVLLTRDTMTIGLPRWLVLVGGGILVLCGAGIKLWAAASLGGKAYYWYNFFAPPSAHRAVLAGPYRFLANQMYTVGYLQAYGFALITGSFVGLWAAAFAQLAILVFYYAVERPHFQRLNGSPP